jgi:hypothetical protein
MSTNRIQQTSFPANTILHGNCIDRMRSLPNNSIAFILTDPPYLVRYQDRAGRSIRNDSNADWLKPAFAEAYRVLKQDRLMVAFYTWTHVDKFLDAWRGAGLRAVGHLVFRKQYASKAGFLKYQHEQAYLLAKGAPALPECPKQDVHAPWSTGNFGGELILTCSGTGSSRGVDPEIPTLATEGATNAVPSPHNAYRAGRASVGFRRCSKCVNKRCDADILFQFIQRQLIA